MQSRKGLGASAAIFTVVGLFMSLSGMGVMNSFVAGIQGQTAYYEDVGAIEEQVVPSAENKCSDVASDSRSGISTSITENIEFTQVEELTFNPSEDEFTWSTEDGGGTAQLSGSCDYVFENTRTGGLSIGQGQWTITITGETGEGQATVFMRADD